MRAERILQMEKISMRFPGVIALDEVDFELMKGEIHGIVGRNGAGKSTLMNVLVGLITPSSGVIRINGIETRHMTPQRAKTLGIQLVPQHIQLVPSLSVAENIFLGDLPRSRWGLVDWKETNTRAERFLKTFQVKLDPTMLAENLGVADQQLVEIVRALSKDAKIIILDEPTPPLSMKEVNQLYSFIQSLSDQGVTFIYISHYLEEIFAVCDRVTVLRDGRNIATNRVADMDEKSLTRMMIGQEMATFLKRVSKRESGKPLLQVRELTGANCIRSISFTLYEGEVLGLAGLKGSGRTELCRLIFGLDRITGGELLLESNQVRDHRPWNALNQGICYLPENRHLEGIIPARSVKENISLPILQHLVSASGFIKDAHERDVVSTQVEQLDIRTPSIDQLVQYLSGGNQQKVVVGKLLATEPKVLLLDEPTQGIDIGSKAEIHRLIDELARKGIGIILISSELDELTSLCDRILVLHEGEIASELSAGASSEEILLAAEGAMVNA